MILFLFKQALGNKDRHVYILYTCLLKSPVQLILDILPDCIPCGLDHHTSLNAGVIAQLSLLYHIRIPLGKILIHGCDGFHHFLIVCHDFSPFLHH